MTEVDTFFASHCAHHAGVVIVQMIDRETGEEIRSAVFSSLPKAKHWVQGRDMEHEAAVFAPYVIDEPDYGNVPTDQQN